VKDVLCDVKEALVVVVAVALELEVKLVADEEPVLLRDFVVLAVDEVCCCGLIMTNTSAPAITSKAMTIVMATLDFDRASTKRMNGSPMLAIIESCSIEARRLAPSDAHPVDRYPRYVLATH